MNELGIERSVTNAADNPTKSFCFSSSKKTRHLTLTKMKCVKIKRPVSIIMILGQDKLLNFRDLRAHLLNCSFNEQIAHNSLFMKSSIAQNIMNP